MLWSYLQKEKLPPKDYSLVYSAEKISELSSKGKLSKKHTAQMASGDAPIKGDADCWQCPFRKFCWEAEYPELMSVENMSDI